MKWLIRQGARFALAALVCHGQFSAGIKCAIISMTATSFLTAVILCVRMVRLLGGGVLTANDARFGYCYRQLQHL
jgi:hypothetical protein